MQHTPDTRRTRHRSSLRRKPSSRGARGPGRPNKGQLLAINALLIGKARELLLNEGYGAASMEAIARAARVSKGTLYARFPTKEALFTAIVEERVATWSRVAARHDHELGPGLRERLEHHAFIFLTHNARPDVAGLARLLMTEGSRFPELARIFFEHAFDFALNILIKEINAAAVRDEIPVRNARAPALALLDSIWGWSSLQGLRNRKVSRAECRQVARERVALLMDGRMAW